jgi:hypothetical protein
VGNAFPLNGINGIEMWISEMATIAIKRCAAATLVGFIIEEISLCSHWEERISSFPYICFRITTEDFDLFIWKSVWIRETLSKFSCSEKVDQQIECELRKSVRRPLVVSHSYLEFAERKMNGNRVLRYGKPFKWYQSKGNYFPPWNRGGDLWHPNHDRPSRSDLYSLRFAPDDPISDFD